MNIQKKLISIFRTFVQKNLLPQIIKYQGDIKEWIKFLGLINNQKLNLSQLQRYVDSLPQSSIINKIQIQNSNRISAKQIEIKLPLSQDKQITKPDFSFNKSFGGQKQKAIFNQSNGFQTDDGRNSYRKNTFNLNKTDESFKTVSIANNVNIIPSVSSVPNNNIQTLSSLDKLLKGLLQNQQKLQIIANFQQRNIY